MFKTLEIQQLLGIDKPIIQAPMAGTSSPELVAAVSNAGGLGSFAAAPLAPDQLKAVLRSIRELTPHPFNVNLFARSTEKSLPGQPTAAFKQLLEQYHKEKGLQDLTAPKRLFGPCDEQLQVLIEEKVPVISFHFGVEEDQVNKIHSAGLKVICSATSVSEAEHLERLGVDAIIAQGAEAGGHRGTYLDHPTLPLVGTLALLPQIVDAVDTPVIAAGGIMDGRGMVACSALGAKAVQLGTAFLGCTEAPVPDLWRHSLSQADATDTVVTSAISGKPARGLANRFVKEVEALTEPLQPYPWHYAMSAPLRQQAIKSGDPDFMVMWSGQGVGLFREMSVAKLIQSLMQEANIVRGAI